MNNRTIISNKQKLQSLYKQKEKIENEILLIEKQIQDNSSICFSLKNAIYIDISKISTIVINQLKELATFDNPQIKLLLSLRKPVYNIPKYIKNFQEDKINFLLILPRGLMKDVINLFKKNDINTEFQDNRYYRKFIFNSIKFSLRDEQKKAIDYITKKDFCMCVAPPGFGKTLLGAKMIEIRQVNTLIVVNKNMLLDQWIERFVEYFKIDKHQIGYLGKSKNKLNGNIDIATMQSLKNNVDIIKQYSFVIVDECHHIPAVTFEKILQNFQGKYLLGLSATPKRKDGMEPIIFQQLGTIAYQSKILKISNNKLKIINTDFKSDIDNFAQLITQLINDKKRNKLIIEQIVQHSKRKILLLTDRIEHIENLEILLKKEDIKYIAVHGSQKKQIQKENIKAIQSSSLVLATTSFFGEGIDFPHLNTIILATPISYYGRLVQYLGRIGRNNSDCIAIDIVDNKNPFTKSAYKKRKEGYKQLNYSF